jgi:Ca-activated chloride channel family protein
VPLQGRLSLTVAIAVGLLAVSLGGQQTQAPLPNPPAPAPSPDVLRFKSGVDLVNVTATVSDSTGRFVPGLRKEDFTVFEDDQPVEITNFSPERVPVSLGVILDTSGSMAGPKLQEAQSALYRFLYDLLGPQDEIFLYRFSNFPVLLQGWTTDRSRLSRALSTIAAGGGTAMYDAVAEAMPLAQQGRNVKKALVVISDGNDTSSRTSIRQLKQMIRESEVLVYAVGIDGESEQTYRRPPQQTQPPPRLPFPFPFPPTRGRPRFQVFGSPGGTRRAQGPNRDRVNASALREMTDDSGGRTEIVRDATDLNPATAAIADELSRQYYLGYQAAAKKDGRWHSIRVEVRGGTYVVRARKGYVAS